MSDTELSSSPAAASIKSTSTEGDWSCTYCGNVNFAWRSACNRCAKARTIVYQKKKKLGQEIGKQAAEKSRGLFSADDWQCNKCGNVNWARRQQCNVCNAPKFGEVEERTGFGGGYNDRGVVEYKERPDSDDEYDEFGRKKKKRDNGVTTTTSNHSKDNKLSSRRRGETEHRRRSARPIDDDEEDDDEDEDDGDLTKYDLSDWGDSSSTETKNKSTERKSASRSHRQRRSSHSRSETHSRSRSRSPIARR